MLVSKDMKTLRTQSLPLKNSWSSVRVDEQIGRYIDDRGLDR